MQLNATERTFETFLTISLLDILAWHVLDLEA